LSESFHNEADLLREIAEGDEQAFAKLYALYAPRLHAYSLKFTRSDQDASDLLQETFVTIWLNRDKLLNMEYLQAWMYKVMARNCLQWLRKQEAEGKRLKQFNQPQNFTNIPTPNDVAQWHELEKAVQHAISLLSDVRKKIYRLNRNEGMKPASIADQLEIPVGTVKNHLSSAVKSIREYLEKEGYVLGLILSLISSIC
jgi:RNA polymerase sigma factor (sigma-70 family)